MPKVLHFVVIDDGGSLRVEDAEPPGERFDVAIRALN